MATIIPFKRKSQQKDGCYIFSRNEIGLALYQYLLNNIKIPRNCRVIGKKFPKELKIIWFK